jgi:hypothetical protein
VPEPALADDGLEETYRLPVTPATDGTLTDILLKITALANEAILAGLTTARPGIGGDVDELAGRLAAALEQCETYRRKLREAQESAVAHKSRADGLAKMNRQLNANLAAIVGSAPVDDRAWNNLDRFVKEKPRTGVRA